VTVLPAYADVEPGKLYRFRAYYDPDGEDANECGAVGVACTPPQHNICVVDPITDAPTCSVAPGVGIDECDSPNDPCPCNFDTTPSRLVIPPLETSTLWWVCPYGCSSTTIRNAASATIATDGAASSTIVAPTSSQKYDLFCGPIFNTSTTLRVFDTTRIEIKP
jgi:hypothetical protein